MKATRRAYTLVEMLIATTLTLVMMGGVVTVFGKIGEGVSAARSTLEMSDALRSATAHLRGDLSGVTAEVNAQPPADPGTNKGYFEYTEGPIGPVRLPGYLARNTEAPRVVSGSDPDKIPFEQDSTAGDADDVLAFTTRSKSEAFIGRYDTTYRECYDAEVVWFVRGRTLYRRTLLVDPTAVITGASQGGFYARYDLSVRWDSTNSLLVCNNLGDLTKPENRFAHQNGQSAPPYHPHYNTTGWADLGTPNYTLARLNMPLLQECADPQWMAGGTLPQIGSTSPLIIAVDTNVLNAPLPFDAWTNPHPWQPPSGKVPVVDNATGVLILTDPNHTYYQSDKPPTTPATNPYPMGVRSGRIGEDVILNNVLAFDVKVWDRKAPVIQLVRTQGADSATFILLPGDGPYPAEAGYTGYAQAVRRLIPANAVPLKVSNTANDSDTTVNPPILYNYKVVGIGAYVDLGYAADDTIINQSTLSDFSGKKDSTSTNPLDRVYDTWSNHYALSPPDVPPPYKPTSPDEGLRSIQIKVRVFEPDSRQIREVTIVHSFSQL